MRFVHVEDFVHPNAGYQLNLLGRLQVEQGHEVIIVTSEIDHVPEFLTSFFGKDNILQKDEEYFKETGVKIIRYPTYAWYSSRAIFKPGLHKFLKSLKPDVLFVHGEDTLTGMKLLRDYKSMNMPYVLDCHMLEMASENKFREVFRLFFRKFITPIILKNEIPLIRVVDSNFVEKHFNIPLEKTKLLSFGTDTNFFRPDNEKKKQYRKEFNIADDDFVVLYAGKLDQYKGGKFFAETMREKFDLEAKNLKIIVVGTPPDNEYGKEVEKILSSSENKILRFPTQDYTGLAKFYQTADIAVYPRQCSMSYYEAQSCGLPVVLEHNEINVERASNKKGKIFGDKSQEEFRQAILEFGNMGSEEFLEYKNNSRENILKNYNYVPIAQEFTDVMIAEYNRFHKK
ncbi:glycosyltransferase family 4 protein [Chryseobacterium taklimakanense]|uniref:glycosyltransferase family 4 protein n=1 Tax=Chryseobacterium taklimakanense TaxID=536441 RepID=UPI001EF5DC63|nr:glycosyltransferase family 4 protein [Chryseobacterium taklimakanense]MCG7280440.1 glycosyltransferase family 4 protein [Chryseobacterium taklimakanense]